MKNTGKIKVPSIGDDPLVGRSLSPMPVGIFYDYITIKDGKFSYIGSKISSNLTKSYELNTIANLLLEKKEVSCWTKDHKLDPYARIGTEMTLYLVDANGVKHELIPKFNIGSGQKKWDQFIEQLCHQSGLRIEVKLK